MIGSEGYFSDLQSPLIQRFRHRVIRLVEVQNGEIVQTEGGVGMIGSEGFFGDLQCPLIEGFRCRVVRLGFVQGG